MRGTLIRTTAALSAAVVVLALSAPAAHGAVLKSSTFQAYKSRVSCGVQLKQLGGISCFSAALPSTELDGFIELEATGIPTLGERGDSPWRPGKSRELKPGQTWRRAGVTCSFNTDGGRAVECRNASGAGFQITPRFYVIIAEGQLFPGGYTS